LLKFSYCFVLSMHRLQLHHPTSLHKRYLNLHSPGGASLLSPVNWCAVFYLKPTSSMVSVSGLISPALSRESHLFTRSPFGLPYHVAVLVRGQFRFSVWLFWSDLWPFWLWPFWTQFLAFQVMVRMYRERPECDVTCDTVNISGD